MMRTSKWVLISYTLVILAGLIAALPNLFTPAQLAAMPGWFPKQQVTLGLDLRGGSHLVLEVDAEALKSERLSSVQEDARSIRIPPVTAALRSEGERRKS